MKKFLSKIMFATVAVLSVAGFTSCNNADDDPIVPVPQPTAQEQPKYQQVPAYVTAVSESILNMYDVKVTLHSGDKSQDVVLAKADGTAVDDNSEGKTVTCYKFMFTEIDGQKGISAAEVKVTPKADIKTTLASMPENETIYVMYGAEMLMASIDANGKVVNGRGVFMHRNYVVPTKMMQDMGNGKFVYEAEAELLETFLNK